MSSQRIVTEFESYILQHLYSKDSKHNLKSLIEKDENALISRKWEFDDYGRIFRELDYRESSISTSIGNENLKTSTTSYREFVYKYHSHGKLESISEIRVNNLDTFTIRHVFDYPNDKTIKESYDIEHPTLGKSEYFIEINKTNEVVDSKVFKIYNYKENSNIESIHKEIYDYDSNKNPILKTNFFTINTFPLEKYGEFEDEKRSSQTSYSYDNLDRLIELNTVEFDENGNSIPNRNVKFEYNDTTSTIKNIEVRYGETYNPREVSIKPIYDDEGIIAQIKVNEKSFIFTKETKSGAKTTKN